MYTSLVLALVEPPSGPDFTRYLLVCGLLVLAIVGIGLLTRKVLGHSLTNRASKRSLQVTDVLPLGGKQRLIVVRCFDRTFLIGQGEKELNKIADLDQLELESMKRMVEEEAQGDFAATLDEQGALPAQAPPTQRKLRTRKPMLRNGEGVVG